MEKPLSDLARAILGRYKISSLTGIHKPEVKVDLPKGAVEAAKGIATIGAEEAVKGVAAIIGATTTAGMVPIIRGASITHNTGVVKDISATITEAVVVDTEGAQEVLLCPMFDPDDEKYVLHERSSRGWRSRPGVLLSKCMKKKRKSK